MITIKINYLKQLKYFDTVLCGIHSLPPTETTNFEFVDLSPLITKS